MACDFCKSSSCETLSVNEWEAGQETALEIALRRCRAAVVKQRDEAQQILAEYHKLTERTLNCIIGRPRLK